MTLLIVIMQSVSAKNSKNYPQGKRYGKNALILIIVDIIFTMFLALLISGLTVGFICTDSGSYYHYRYGREL